MAVELTLQRPVLRSTFLKTLHDQRRALVWWAIGLFASGATYAPFYPSIKENAQTLEKYMQSMPEFLRQAFLGASGDFTSPAGYLNTELFNFFAPILMLLFAIGAGARAIAGEEERQTLDVLLASPITRRRVVLEKYVAMLVGGALLSVVLWLSIPITGSPFELTPSLWDLAAACLMTYLLAIAFGSIALAVGCATGRRALAIGVTAGLAAAAYLIDLLTPAIESVEWLQYLSPFHYFLDPEPMMKGLGVGGSIVLAAISIVAIAVALVTFERRDLAA